MEWITKTKPGAPRNREELEKREKSETTSIIVDENREKKTKREEEKKRDVQEAQSAGEGERK